MLNFLRTCRFKNMKMIYFEQFDWLLCCLLIELPCRVGAASMNMHDIHEYANQTRPVYLCPPKYSIIYAF